MQKIIIVSDSVANIPDNLIKRHGIITVPLNLCIDDKIYREGIDITPNEVYELLEKGIKITTSAPSIGDFIKIYENIFKEKKADFIYSVHLSSFLSSTFNSAFQASKNFTSDKIKVIDSRLAALSQGFVVLEAARAAEANKKRAEIESIIEILIGKSIFFATFGNFEYVFKGGRAPFLKKILSKTLIFKPIITFNKKGKLSLAKFTLNKKSSIIKLYTEIKKAALLNGVNKIGICYGKYDEQAKILADMINSDKRIIIDECIFNSLTSVMAVHTGPDILGIAVCPSLNSRVLIEDINF